MHTRTIPSTTGTAAAGPSRPGRRPGRTGRIAALSAVGVVGLAFAACGGSSGASSTTATTAPATGASPATPRPVPGTSGTIAAVTGTTLQVQNPTTGQTAVSYTSSTVIRATTTTTASAVTVGSCITALGKPTGASTGSTPFGEPITATTVSINQPVNGACGRGGFGGRPAGTSGTRPAGGGFGGGGFGGGTTGTGTRPAGGFAGGAFGVASGQVTAVSGSTATVDETNPRTQKTSSVVVTLTGTTTFTTTATATPAAIVVGQCARAVGPADSTGAVTATSLTISAPVNGSCTTGFGFRGGFGGGTPPAGATTGA